MFILFVPTYSNRYSSDV